MWSPGTFQSGNQLEVAQPVLSQRKRSIDLVRQAQFAACSYLGFDPYEEKHKNGLVHQVSTSDGSLPVELHLHHHHHHHCRENDEVLKRPSHMSASADSPLGVGSLLSLCDHIQMFQDAWQGHSGRADERSQKFMLHGSVMKRDSSFAGFEAGLPASNDKKENIRERSFPLCADRYWNGGIAAAPAMAQTSNENHHFNTAARISHWECSVVQEEKLTKGFGVRIGQAERSRPLDTSDFLASSADFGWMADSKHTSLATAPNTAKVERTYMSHSGDASISSVSTQESLSGSHRKFGSVVSKRKKSFSDMDVGHDQRSLSSSNTTSRSCMDTKTISQSRQAQTSCMSAKKVPGLQLPARGFTAEEPCDSPGCETGRTTISSCSGKGGDGFPLKTGLSLNCDECTCQQSLPTPRSTPRSLSSSHQDKQEITGVQMSVQGLMKDLKVGLDTSNVSSKQNDLSEKIISLDESENGDAYSPQFVRIMQERSVVKKPNLVSSGKDFSSLSAPFTKVSEDCNGRLGLNDASGKRGQHLSAERGTDNISSRNAGLITPKNEQIVAQNGFTAEKDHSTHEFNSLNANTRATRMSSTGYQPHGGSTLKKDLGKASQDVQMELYDQDSLQDRAFTWQQVQCKTGLPSKSPLKSLAAEPRREIRPSKLWTPENVGLVNKKTDTGAMGKSDGFLQAGENGHFVLETTTPKRTTLPKECISQGSLRVHQQLECEKMRHEFSKQELEHVKKDYDDFLRDLSAGKDIHVKKDYDDFLRDLSAGKDIQTSIPEGDGFSNFFALLQEREGKKLTLEFEARLAAEEKARIYEASAEAAESRLLQLLDERTKLHLKFDEELEQKEVERLRLHSLFEKERLKSEVAKKELQDLKEKFASLLSRAPLSSGVKSDDLREISLSPRHFFKLSDVLEKRDIFENEKREELSLSSSIGDCGKAQKKIETIEDAMTERSIQFKNREACILQQVRQQEMQLKTAEDAFQELERKLKHVELDKSTLKECPDYSQTQHKLTEKSTQTSSWNDGVYEKYSCVYQSPIFEHNHPKAKSGKGFFDETSETDSDERVSNNREQGEYQTDIEIRQLTEELKIIGADMLSVHKIPDSNGNNFARIEEFKHAESSLDKQMNEEEVTNQSLKRRLKEKTVQLNKALTQHAKELQRMQNSTSQAHEVNKQLASNLANSETKLAELQEHYDSLLESLENQLKEASKDVQDLRKDADQLRDDLSESNKKLKELKESAELKQVELSEARRVEQELKSEKDTVEKEKSDLSVKLQEAQKEVNEQASRVVEYMSINEELLDFAQRKESEVSTLSQQVQTLQQQILEKANVDSKLQSDFEEARRRLNEVQKAYSSIESENEILKSKLSENNLQLLQQEGTIATLTKQMADIMQGRDSMLEEAAQFHGYLQNAKYKEFELENKLRQSSLHIKDLEERLQDMESETFRSGSELADLKEQNSTLQKSVEDKDNEALGLKKSVNDMRKKVQDLEEEVMLKEGQIAIISSQNRESYETF